MAYPIQSMMAGNLEPQYARKLHACPSAEEKMKGSRTVTIAAIALFAALASSLQCRAQTADLGTAGAGESRRIG